MAIKNNTVKSIISKSILVICAAWLIYLLLPLLKNPTVFLPDSLVNFAYATLLLFISMLIPISIFRELLSTGRDNKVDWQLALSLQSSGSLLRYLPGRIWGIIYQASTCNEISKYRIIRANIEYMIFALLFTSTLAFTIIFFKNSSYWLATFTPIIGVVFIYALLNTPKDIILSYIQKITPRKIFTKLTNIHLHRLTAAATTKILLSYSLSWAFYLYAWHILSQSFSILSNIDAIHLCATYSIASVVGIISLLTPAGAGIREAVFIAMNSSKIEAPILAFIAILMRIWVLTVEIFIWLLALTLRNKSHSQAQARKNDTNSAT